MQYVDKIAKNQQKTQQQNAARPKVEEDNVTYVFEDDIGVTERDPNAKVKRRQKKRPQTTNKQKGGFLDGFIRKKKKQKAVRGN